jgi:hypothetical protein
MLGIPESAVRDRAHAALDALAEEPGRPRAERPHAERPLVERSLVERPREEHPREEHPREERPPGGRPGKRPSEEHPREPRAARAQPTGSRRAGAILLGVIVAVIVVVVVLVSTGGGKGSSTGTTSSTTASTSTSAGKPTLNKTISLSSPDPELKASGTAYVLSESGRSAFYITAQGLPESKGFFYAVWLYNSPSSSTPLGRASNVGSDGRMQGGNPLPTNASLYRQLIVTRETSTHPSHPGPIMLRGTFALH